MNSNTQHGCQPAPQQTAPPTDPRTRNHSPPTASPGSQDGICRDFLWGICTLGTQCIYRHELEFEAMKAVLKFCHRYQNRSGCARSDCTYLHTTREEESLFLTTGQLPRALIERYSGATNASASAAPAGENVLNVPPQAMIYQILAQPPPPPPPRPTPTTAGTDISHSSMQMSHIQNPMQGPMPNPMQNMQGPMPGPIQGPMLGPMQGPMLGSMQGPMQGPMSSPIHGPLLGPMQGPMPGQMQGPMPGQMQGRIPGQMQGPMPGPMHGPMQGPMPAPAPIPSIPPQPLPLAPTTSPSTIRVTGPVYSAQLPQSQHIVNVYHPASTQENALPAMYDPSRPPPPLPQSMTCRKRPAEDSQAGPNKLRKSEPSNDGPCESCVERLIRTDQLLHQIEQLEQQAEQSVAEIANKMEQYDRKKQVIRSSLNPDIYRRVEEFIENGSSSPFSSIRNEVYSPSPFSSPVASSASSNGTMNQLMELLLGNSTRGLFESLPSTTASDDAVSHLPSSARARQNNETQDFMALLLEAMRSAPERSSSTGSSEGELIRPSTSANGFGRFQAGGASPPGPSAPRFSGSRAFHESVSSSVVAGTRPYEGAGTAATLGAGARSFAEAPASRLLEAAGPSNSIAYGESAYESAAPARYPAPVPPPARHFQPAAAPDPFAPHYMPGTYASPVQPPAARPFFNQFPANHMPNPPYPGANLNQSPRPPMPPQNNPYFMGNRYPNQHYYHPPYQ